MEKRFGVAYKSPHPEQRKKDAEQAQKHSADMKRLEEKAQRGLKK